MYGKDVPEPEAVHCTKWFNNPLTRVAYNCNRYGSTHSDLENLSRPVNSLYFAGLCLYKYVHVFITNLKLDILIKGI
jgi:hypothetical protein